MSAEEYGQALAELEALNRGSVVLDSDGEAWQKQDDRWTCVARGVNTELMDTSSVAILTPLTIIYRAPKFDQLCPDCKEGKHGACVGEAWDDEKDAPANCQCAHRDTGTADPA